jgi:hypothetical protein
MKTSFHNYYSNKELKQILLDLKKKYEEDFAFVGNTYQVMSSKKNLCFEGILVNCEKVFLQKNWVKYDGGLRELRGNAESNAAYFTPVTHKKYFLENSGSIWIELKNFMADEVEVKEMIL